MAGFASALRELRQPDDWNTQGCSQEWPKQKQLRDAPRIATCLDRSLRRAVPGVLQGRAPTRFSLADYPQLDSSGSSSSGSSCTRQPSKLGSCCKVQPPAASEQEVPHSHINCTGSARMQADVDRSMLWNKELTPKLGGSCTVPAPARQVVQHSLSGCTRSAVLQVDSDGALVRGIGPSAQLGDSCSVPAAIEHDFKHSHFSCPRSALVQAYADGSLLRSKAPPPQRAVSPLAFSSSLPHTWPVLTGSHMPNLGRCGGQPNKTDHMHCRSVSDGPSMPRLLLTPSSLMPVETVDRSTTRISAEDGSSTTEPCSSIGSDAFSEFLEGDPWEGCEELAAQGLAEWYRDFLGNKFGQQQVRAELPPSEEHKFKSIDQPAHLHPCSALHKKPPQRFLSAAW